MAENNTIQFNKTKQGIQIQMLVSSDKGVTGFKTLMTKDKKEILLDEVVSNSPLLKDANKYPFFNVFDFIVRRNQLFIFYNDFGQVFVDTYMFDPDIVETKKRHFIGKFGIISYENGGDLNSVCSATWINNDLYFHINARQAYGGYLNELFVFRNDIVKKIIFTETKSLILLKPVKIDKWGTKEWYDTNLNLTDNPQEDIARLDLLSKYYNLPFGYYKMPLNNDTYTAEGTYLRRNGLEEHKLIPWAIPNGKELDIEQKETITNYIHYILSEYTHADINKIDLLGCISCYTFRKYDYFGEDITKIKHFTISFSGDMLYFFVLVNSSQLHVVRYNQSSNDWLIADYVEDEVKIEE